MVNITPITNVFTSFWVNTYVNLLKNEMLKSLDGKKHVNVFFYKNIASFLRHQTTLNEPYLNEML